jgi:outer membrane protein assembly factor BamB
MSLDAPLEPQRSTHVPIRWWPAWLILGLAVVGIGIVRLWPESSFQEKNLRTASGCVFTVALLLIWMVAFSRMRWRIRLLACGATVLCLSGLAASIRIRGVSGDLFPILEWRFKRESNAAAPPAAQAPTAKAQLPTEPIASASTNDYPQFLGLHRTGMVDGLALARDWQAHPPKLRWRRSVGAAWSGFAIKGGRAITMEQRGEDEAVSCYDLTTGEPLWSHLEAAHYNTTIAGEGPRTTPTIEGDRVLTMGATGLLNCLNLATGQQLWMKNVPEDNHGTFGEWGASCSPLLVGERVIVCTGANDGRSLAAYRLDTGARLWTGGSDRASYSSPVLLNVASVPQILSFNSSRLTAHDPATGAVLWEHPWPTGHPHIATPVLIEPDKILVSSGYGTGSELLRVSHGSDASWTVQRLWKSNRLKSKFTNLIYCGGYIYGLDDGILTCLEAATGRLLWKEGRYGHGQIIGAGELLLIMAENGEVVMIQASPDAPRELTRFKALSGKTWNPPAIAGQHLLVRNDLEAACFTLPLAVADHSPALAR